MTLAGFGAAMVLSGCGNAAQVGLVTVTTGAGAIGVVALEARTSFVLEAELLDSSPLGTGLLELALLELALLELALLGTAGVSGVSVTDCVVLALQAVTHSKATMRRAQRIKPAF